MDTPFKDYILIRPLSQRIKFGNNSLVQWLLPLAVCCVLESFHLGDRFFVTSVFKSYIYVLHTLL